jgi:hypothetical protein
VSGRPIERVEERVNDRRGLRAGLLVARPLAGCQCCEVWKQATSYCDTAWSLLACDADLPLPA